MPEQPQVEQQPTGNAIQQEKTLRNGLARVHAALVSKEATESVASLSMEDLITEAIFQLDSSQLDLTSQIEQEPSQTAKAELYRAQGVVGLKQRLDELNLLMVGDGESKGLIQQAREFQVPSRDEFGEVPFPTTGQPMVDGIIEGEEGTTLFFEEGQEAKVVGGLSTRLDQGLVGEP